MKSDNNKFLKVRKFVKLTGTIDSAIALLDGYFEQANLHCEVSSGLRTSEEQLKIIVNKCLKHKVDKEFPLIRAAKLSDTETWLNPWGRLLTIGEMVNPPMPTKCPFDFKRSDGTIRKAGTLIPTSGHQLGADFDISGYNQELNLNIPLDDIVKVLETFIKSGNAANHVSGYLKEPVNGAVHVDCIELKLNNF
jgi:hypothetical protein